MAKKELPDFRFQLIDRYGCTSYIVAKTLGGRRVVTYVSASETPQALSNMFPRDAAAVRFAIEDAKTTGHALQAMRNAENFAKAIAVLP